MGPMGISNRDRKRVQLRWTIALIIIAVATLLASGVLITLDVQKVSVEKKVDQKAAEGKTLSRVAPELPVQPPAPSNN